MIQFNLIQINHIATLRSRAYIFMGKLIYAQKLYICDRFKFVITRNITVYYNQFRE